MQPLQGLAAGDLPALDRLREGLARSGGVAWVKRTFLTNYLGRLDDPAVLSEFAALIASQPETAFGYAHAYGQVRPPREQPIPVAIPANWWEDIPS